MNSDKVKMENAKGVRIYLKECGVFYLATTEGPLPRVRPFGIVEEINKKVYIITAKRKNVYRQMMANNNIQICALHPNGDWIRITGTIVNDDNIEVKKEIINRNPDFKNIYSPTDPDTAVLYIKDGEARIITEDAPDKVFKF